MAKFGQLTLTFQTALFRKRNEIILQFFVDLFIASLEYLDIALSEIKAMSETVFSAPFTLTLKETTLSELGYSSTTLH